MTGYTGFQLACYGGTDQSLRYRHRQDNGTWHPWLTLAFTSQLKDPANYYWANVKVSTASSTTTVPTFAGANVYGNINSNYYMLKNSSTNPYLKLVQGYTWYVQAYNSAYLYLGTGYTNSLRINYKGDTYTPGTMSAAQGFYHPSVNSNSYVLLAGGSYKNLSDFVKGNAGSATKGVYVTGGTVTAMTYSLAATVNSGTAGKLVFYSGSNSLSSYNNTIGSIYQPVYINAGVPTICSYYSFLGTSQQPVVLVSGYFYRNRSTNNSWYYTGYKHSQIGSPTFYVNGGVMRLTFSNSKRCSFISAAAQGRQSFSGRNTANVQAYNGSNGNYGWRSEGSYWFNSAVENSSYTSYLYIRAYRQANNDNDSWYTGDTCWKQEEDAIQSVSFTIFGCIYP